MDKVTCPYCMEDLDFSLEIEEYYSRHESFCKRCNKYFVITAEVIINFKTSKADYLNECKHK